MLGPQRTGNTVEESRRVVREAYGVLRTQPRFVAWPLVAVGSTLVVWTSCALVVTGVVTASEGVRSAVIPIGAGLGLLSVVATRFLWCVAAVTVTYGLSAARRGETLVLSRALSMTFARWQKILAWVAFSATVGFLLRMLSSVVSGVLGRIMQEATFLAWAAATYYVVPIVAFEDLPVVDSLQRSSTLLAKYPRVWIGSNVAIQLVVSLAFVVPMVVASFALHYLRTTPPPSTLTQGAVVVVVILAVVVFFAAVAALSALQSSVRVVLYHNAKNVQ